MITVSTKELKAALQTMKKIVRKKTHLPVLSHVRIEAAAGVVRLTGTDLDLRCTTELEAEGKGKFVLATPLDDLLRLLRKVDRKVTTVKLATVGSGDERRLSVTADGKSFTLSVLPADEFPAGPNVEYKNWFSLEAGDLQALADRVAFAASTEDSRPILSGVNLETTSGVLRACATNGHLLALSDMVLKGRARDASAIVPTKTFALFRRTVSDTDKLNVQLSAITGKLGVGTHITMEATKTVVTARLIDGPYPNYRQVIPAGHNAMINVDGSDLLAAFERAEVVVHNTKNKAVAISTDTYRGRDVLVIAAASEDGKKSTERVNVAKATGKIARTGLNAGYVISTLKAMSSNGSAARVQLFWEAPERPTKMIPVGTATTLEGLYLLMPLRLND